MIRYDVDRTILEAEIKALDPRWFEKAAERTRRALADGRFDDPSPIWSRVKPAFMRLQHNKCIFCERRFETPEYGTIEFDLEHFRPKSSVAAWPDPGRHGGLEYASPMGDSNDTGYYWLAYDPENYAASCKVCNTTFKLNYFPIAGQRATGGARGNDLAAENPFLCYPIGTTDEDPRNLVTFIATTAIPAAATGHRRRRGQVIIDFFGFNKREGLHKDRAQMIAVFAPALLAVHHGRATPLEKRLAAQIDSPIIPHAGCLRAYNQLCERDLLFAERVFEQCRELASSLTDRIPATS